MRSGSTTSCVRRRRPVAALMVVVIACALSGVGVGPAAAEPGLQVAVTASTSHVTYGGTVTLAVTVTDAESGLGLGGIDVDIVRTEAVPTTEFEYASTQPDGTARLVAKVTATTSYIVRAVDPERGLQADSVPVVVQVAFAVTTTTSPVAVPPGGQLTVSGRVRPPPASTVASVEERVGSGAWRPLGTVTVAADGTFNLPVGRRTALGTYTFRVSKPSDGNALAGVGEGTARVTVSGAGPVSAWRPIAGTKASPARWGTCSIGYHINPDRVPPGGLADLREAMRRVTQVSGIRFRYLGRTSVVPYVGYRGAGRNRIVVAWTPLFPSIGGVGGTTRTGKRILSGFLVMNTAYRGKTPPGFGAGTPRGMILMHELGHVVGLDHVTNAKQIMYPGTAYAAAVWGAGDRRGLQAVGAHCR